MSRRSRGLGPPAARVAACLLFVAVGAAGAAHAKALSSSRKAPAARLDVRAADTLLARGGAHAKALEKWAAGASLDDLVWLLRRTPAELGASQPVLVRAALDKVPASRTALAARLVAAAGPGVKLRRGLPPAVAPPARPNASVFRVGTMMPDSGDYADYGRALAIGLEIGVQSVPAPGGRTIDCEFWGTGADEPSRVAADLEAASWRDGVLVGELLSVNTFPLATGARLLGLPLVSPTATDEAVGTVGPQIFQIGPSAWVRGERLAHAMITKHGMRAGILVAGDPERSPFALGFAAAAESLGATIDWRAGYSTGTGFRTEVQQLAAKKLDVLLWDGEPSEVETLLREMARQKVTVQLGGSESLAPERMHAETRVLMEGVRYVSEEWKLGFGTQARLDSALVERGAGVSTPLYVRGWLAGRVIAQAIAGGALAPEEVVAALTARCAKGPWLASRRFLDLSAEDVSLPLFTVVRGRAVMSQTP